MSSLAIDPLFSRRETTVDRVVEGRTAAVVSEMVIETALPLVLTQDVAKKDAANHQLVPPTADLTVYGDEVTVSGPLSLPGRRVIVFARVLRAEPGVGGQAPAVVVDGPALPDKEARLPDLARDSEPNPKPAVGGKGARGYDRSTMFGENRSPGGRGQSREEAPDLMDGDRGKDGNKGSAAGQVWICCGRADAAGGATLLVSAVGGPGGNGQRGQPGAQGGPGGDGADFVLHPYSGSDERQTAGGPGGHGGNGGPGGRGGQGGDGGRVTIHCIAAMPTVAVATSGGRGGDPGDGGAHGERGEGGQGGTDGFGRKGAPDGAPGDPGAPGAKGAPAPPSKAGDGSVTTGELDNEDLASRASVTQLHMMLERTRAIYLVTEPPTYRLQQPMVADVGQLPPSGRNLVVLAMVGTALHVRVFDAAGAKAVDRAERELPAGELLEKVRGWFEFDIGHVLVAGKWITPQQREELPAGAQRELLCAKLGEWAQQTPAFFRALDDATLAGDGAMTVFLRDMRIRDQAGLLTSTFNDQRNTLIVENGRTGRSDLQALRNAPLVRLGLGWSGRRDLRQAFLDRTGDEEQQIVSEAFALTGHVDAWAGIGERLAWLQRLLKHIPEPHVQKALARSLAGSTWSAFNRHRAGLDYFGNAPSFVPVLALREYEEALHRSLANLSAIAEKRNAYLQEEQDLTTRRANLSHALAATEAHVAYLTTRRTPIENDIGTLNDTIGSQNRQLDDLRPELLRQLRGFEQQVGFAFGLGPETFFNCLSQLSFMSPHAPANPKTFVERFGGPASAVAMGVSQGGAMVTEGLKNVLSDTGELVNKDYVLGRIDVVRKGLDLRTELRRRGPLFDKGASDRLLVELDQFRELVDQFHKSIASAGDLRDRLDKYMGLMESRNHNVDAYNCLVCDLAELVAETKRLTLQKHEAEGLLAKGIEPGLAVMTTFVSQLHDRAKEECVRQLYMASRAHSFWALRPYSQFFDLIGRSPGAVTVEQLRTAETGFRASVLDALRDNGRPPSFFPKSEASESSLGQVVMLTSETHADFFAALRDRRHADFTLEPATFASSAPASAFDPTLAAWSGQTRPDFDKDAPNPFCGMANVRLTKARVWLLTDAPSSGNHRLLLIHLGKEQFRKRDDEPFPARTDPAHEADLDLRHPEFVEHQPIEIPFSYDATGMRLDLDRSPPLFTPGRMREDTQGTVDGDLDFPGDRDLGKLAASSYAPIGPFGRWRLVVRRNENPTLDLDDVSRILIDFHGYFHTYQRHSDPDGA